jgi:outer membrane protein OmpA-like peptidoglycan-associated protein
MDRQAQEIKKKIPDFDVTLLDKGIKLAMNTDVLFELDRFDLKDRMRKDLDGLAAIFQRYPDTHIEIRGFTDNTGSDSHNTVLSGDRAKAAEKYLEDKGIAPGRITAKGYGATTPKYPNDTETNRALNRRVEFYITK